MAGLLIAAVAAASFAAVPAQADTVADKQAEARQVADKLAALEDRLNSLDAQSETAGLRLEKAKAEVVDAQARVDQANAELGERQGQLRDYAKSAYMTGNDAPGFEAMITSDSDTGPQKRSYLESISGDRQDLVDSLNATRATAEQEATRLAQAQAEAEAYTAQIEDSQTQAASAVSEQQALNSRVQGELATAVKAEQDRRAAAAAAAAQAAIAAAPAPAPATTSTTRAAGGSTTTAPARTATPSTPSTPAPAAPAPSAPGGPVRSGAAGAVAAGMSKIGAPYIWAAAGPNSFDCSGFTMWAWGQAGVSLGHYTGSQWAQTQHISVGELQPGDLVFFWGRGDGADPGHVGLYIGGGMMVHAPGAGRYVRTDSINYWTGATVRAGRVR